MASRSYKHPPIQEVICELVLGSAVPWDLTVPGVLYEKLKGQFPKSDKRLVQQAEVQQSPQGAALNVTQSERAVFLSLDGHQVIQVGERLVAVNQLSPYQGWLALRGTLTSTVQALADMHKMEQPPRRLLLKYLDRVEIPGNTIQIEDFFRFHPSIDNVKSNSPLDHWTAFLVGIQIPYDGQRDALRIQLSNVHSGQNNRLAYLLETEYRLDRPGEITAQKTIEWFNLAHERVTEAFETVITDRLRALFDTD